MSDKKKRCYHCEHSGSMFKISSGTHCHCEHPDEKISGNPGWDSLRFAFDTCPEFEPMQAKKTTPKVRGRVD